MWNILWDGGIHGYHVVEIMLSDSIISMPINTVHTAQFVGRSRMGKKGVVFRINREYFVCRVVEKGFIRFQALHFPKLVWQVNPKKETKQLDKYVKNPNN